MSGGALTPVELLRSIGVSATGLQRLSGGQSNEVWATGDFVLRIARRGPERLAREALLMERLPAAVKAPALVDPAPVGLVHGDLHFGNLLWDGERIAALLDFEYAGVAPLDRELDLLLRFCAHPHLFVAASAAGRCAGLASVGADSGNIGALARQEFEVVKANT